MILHENFSEEHIRELQKISKRDPILFHLFHEENFCMGDIKVDINPIKKEKSGNIVEFLGRAAYYMEQELAFSIADRYITIQDATEGYEYTIYGADFQEIDGGVYDNPDISIYEAVNESVEDLKQHPDTNGTKGSIEKNSVLVPLNVEEFEEAVEKHNELSKTRGLAEHICSQEELGNRDVAQAVIEVRREVEEKQEKKEKNLHNRKR